MSVIEEQLNKGERALRLIKREDQISPDLFRLVTSMRKMLIRTYPNPEERAAAATAIMQRVRA